MRNKAFPWYFFPPPQATSHKIPNQTNPILWLSRWAVIHSKEKYPFIAWIDVMPCRFIYMLFADLFIYFLKIRRHFLKWLLNGLLIYSECLCDVYYLCIYFLFIYFFQISFLQKHQQMANNSFLASGGPVVHERSPTKLGNSPVWHIMPTCKVQPVFIEHFREKVTGYA